MQDHVNYQRQVALLLTAVRELKWATVADAEADTLR
jgi:hypothetical protein